MYYRVPMVTTVANQQFCREHVAIRATAKQFSLLDLFMINNMLFPKIKKTLKTAMIKCSNVIFTKLK